MAATSLFREVNKRGTIAQIIAHFLCGHLIFYNQVGYNLPLEKSHNMQPTLSSLRENVLYMFPPLSILSWWKPHVLLCI